MGFSRQEHWSGLSLPSPGDLPDPGIEPGFLYCRWILCHLSQQGGPEELEFPDLPVFFVVLSLDPTR